MELGYEVEDSEWVEKDGEKKRRIKRATVVYGSISEKNLDGLNPVWVEEPILTPKEARLAIKFLKKQRSSPDTIIHFTTTKKKNLKIAFTEFSDAILDLWDAIKETFKK